MNSAIGNVPCMLTDGPNHEEGWDGGANTTGLQLRARGEEISDRGRMCEFLNNSSRQYGGGAGEFVWLCMLKAPKLGLPKGRVAFERAPAAARESACNFFTGRKREVLWQQEVIHFEQNVSGPGQSKLAEHAEPVGIQCCPLNIPSQMGQHVSLKNSAQRSGLRIFRKQGFPLLFILASRRHDAAAAASECTSSILPPSQEPDQSKETLETL